MFFYDKEKRLFSDHWIKERKDSISNTQLRVLVSHYHYRKLVLSLRKELLLSKVCFIISAGFNYANELIPLSC